MNLEKIKEELSTYIQSKKLNVYEINYLKKDQTLSIILDEKLDMDKLEEISEDLSKYMDKYDDEFVENYILDISTVGAERPIRDKDELIKAINEYIYIKTAKEEYYGTLISFNENIIELEIKDKTRKLIKNINYQDVKQVRYAVKF